MTKYSRITGKVFGAAAEPTGDNPQIGQFGSALAGTYNGTSDIAEIQNLAAWDNGFIGCVTPNTQFPPLPEMTGFGKVLSQQICYLLQQGIAEWDNATNYYTNNWCSLNGKLYIALQDSLNQNPSNTVGYWLEYITTAVHTIGEPIITLDYTLTNAPAGCVWLDGSGKDKTNYASLYAIYGDDYYDGTVSLGSNDFQLPNFNNRTIWGGASAGYIAAGLPNISGSVSRGSSDTTGGIFGGSYTSTSALTTSSARSLSFSTQSSSTQFYRTLNFNASRSNSIYGNSTTVQTESIKARVYTRYQ
jgi:hypothetical protein